MNQAQRSDMHPFAARLPRAVLAVALVLEAALASCGGASGGDEHDEHAHGSAAGEEEHGHEGEHANEGPRTDPHHVAENREDCADDVALPEEALERYGIAVEPVREMKLAPKVSAPGHLALCARDHPREDRPGLTASARLAVAG